MIQIILCSSYFITTFVYNQKNKINFDKLYIIYTKHIALNYIRIFNNNGQSENGYYFCFSLLNNNKQQNYE